MSEQLHQMCRFCHRNVKLAYYCENCGSSCCSDCLKEKKMESFRCQKCDSINIEFSDSGNKKICKDCGSEDIFQSTQLIKSCPKCGSTSIINIYEKKENLEKQFLNLIKNTRDLVEPLNEIVNNLYYYRQKVLNARNPPIKCYHFPQMESELLALFKLFIYTKQNLQEKIKLFFVNISRNRDYFFNIYSQPNGNISILSDILENLSINFNSIKETITNNIKAITTSLNELQKNLDFIDKLKIYFSSFRKYLNLADDEKPIYAIRAKLSNGLNTHDKYKKNKGILFITNYDLSFIHEFGHFKKKKEVIFKAPVKDLTRIKIVGKIFKKLYIEFEYGRYEFTLPPNTISKVMDYIILARNFENSFPYDEEVAKKLNNIELEISDLITYIEEGINSFFSMRCQYSTYKADKKSDFHERTTMSHPIHQVRYFYPNYCRDPLNESNHPVGMIHSNPPYPENYERAADPGSYHVSRRDDSVPYVGLSGYSSERFRGRKNPRGYIDPFIDLDPYYQRFMDFAPGHPPYLRNPGFYLGRRKSSSDSIRYEDDGYPQSFDNLEYGRENYLYSYNPNKINRRPPASRMPPRNGFQINPDYSKIHLTDIVDDNFNNKDDFFNDNLSLKTKQKLQKLANLEEEHYVLESTLKTLNEKFDQGVISDVDYFRRYQNLMKKIYVIEKKMEEINKEIKENESIRNAYRELDKKRYFT